jgi:hypothetical protein
MPQESLPSKNTALLDVPEVHQFKTEFQYFYWTADEYENGLGSSEAALKQLPSETFDASYVAKTRRLPRLIKLDWKPVLIKERISVFGNDIKIKDHLAKLHSEETFTSNDFTSFVFQDSGLDMRLKFFVDNFICTGIISNGDIAFKIGDVFMVMISGKEQTRSMQIISASLICPSGFTKKVPLYAIPASSM